MPSKDPAKIEAMFARIAPVYDFFNHAFSLNIDQAWRRYTVNQVIRPGDRAVLDVACGTGDLTVALSRRAPAGCRVVGLDFCLPMLRRATRKAPLPFLHGDGLRLPFPDESFDAVTIGFGLRNMASHRAGLAEMRRVLRPGGRLAVLEFTTPRNPLFRLGYLTYFKYLLPAFGNLFSGSRAYSYLAESVLEWPDPRELARSMRSAGFDGVRWSMLSFGIAVLHIGTVKPVPEATP